MSALPRLFLALLLSMALSGVDRLAEEVIEHGVHLVEQGHDAHADFHPEGTPTHADDDEHDCTGTLHNCGCCQTQPLARGSDSALAPCSDVSLLHLPPARDQLFEGIYERVERPPRA